MDWQTVLALLVNAMGTVAGVYICLPRNRKRVSGFWMGFTALMGIFAGILCNSVAGDHSDGFPLDLRRLTGTLFGRFIAFENFTVGVAIPFIVLALVLAFIPEAGRRKQR